MNENNFIVTTDTNIQKVISSDITTLTVPAYTSFPPPPTYSTFSFSHNLEYIPSARVWYEVATGYWLPIASLGYEGIPALASQKRGSFYLTEDSLVVQFQRDFADYNIRILYRIYLDD